MCPRPIGAHLRFSGLSCLPCTPITTSLGISTVDLSDKTWRLIKTNRPTNWEAGSGWAVLQIETVLVHYPLIEATKGSGKHPSKTHSYTSSEGIGFRTTKCHKECSNQELYRWKETKAQKHKYCRITPITQLMWQRTSFLAFSQLFSWPLFTPSLVPDEGGQEKNFPDPLSMWLWSWVGKRWADRVMQGLKVVISIPDVACL